VGDRALAHGATGVALTGGLTNRLLPQIAASRFAERLCDKGRYRTRMEGTPVRLVTHPQPGLFGAAAAFARLR
jgi:glucokinase